MNQQRRREIQVGIMVVVALIILIAGLAFFKRVSFDQEMAHYAADFSAVEGLRKGDRVQVRGIRVGSVTGFEFLPGKVRVHMEIEDWVRLYENARVILVMKGIVGEVLLEIEPGEGTIVQEDYVFQGRNAASMLALGDKVNRALDQMTAVGEEVRGLLGELRGKGLIAGALGATERTMLQLEGAIAENRQSLRSLTRNLTDLTATLDASLGSGELDTTLVATRDAAVSIDRTMAELRQTNAQASALLARLEAGEGTLGKLLEDPTLYAQADSTLASLQRLSDQLRRNPKQMIEFSLF